MDNSLILAILNLVDKNIVNTMIDNGFLNQDIKLCENKIRPTYINKIGLIYFICIYFYKINLLFCFHQ